MRQVKLWQIVLFVAAAGAIVLTAYRLWRGDSVEVAHDLLVADIATGQVFEIDTNGKGIALPAKHPETGDRTLYPIFRGEGGQWTLESRALAAINARELETGGAIDKETGVVTVESSKIRRINARRLVKR